MYTCVFIYKYVSLTLLMLRSYGSCHNTVHSVNDHTFFSCLIVLYWNYRIILDCANYITNATCPRFLRNLKAQCLQSSTRYYWVLTRSVCVLQRLYWYQIPVIIYIYPIKRPTRKTARRQHTIPLDVCHDNSYTLCNTSCNTSCNTFFNTFLFTEK